MEESELNSLLIRHRKSILREINESNLIEIVLKNKIISESICEISDDVEKCDFLIENLSKSGFDVFKKFCYSIDNECPGLITDLINDRYNYDNTDIGDTRALENAESSISASRETLNSHRSQRSTSYCGSVTPTQPLSSRRSSLAQPGTPQPNNDAQSISETHSLQQSFIQKINLFNQNSNSNTPPILPLPNNGSLINSNLSNNSASVNNNNIVKARLSPSTLKRQSKRFSSPPYSDSNNERFRTKEKHDRRSSNETIEILADQVTEENVSDRTSWEYHTVTLSRVPGYGFGIAVSGGRDNPHFANGDPSIAVSDVLKAGPAEDRLQVNDRIISVNGISLENVEYATAVQVLRDSGNTVTLVIKRRVPNPNILLPAVITPHHQHSHSLSSTGLGTSGINNNTNGSQQQIKVILSKANKKDDFGIVLGCRLFVKEISSKAREQLISNGYSLQEGDVVSRIHNTNCNDAMSLKDAKKIMDGCKERLNLAVLRDITNAGSSGMQSPVYSHTAQVSNCSNMEETFLNSNSYSAQNLYVQPPTRPAVSTLLDDKSNLTPRGRSRGPLTDISLSQLDRPSTPQSGPSASHLRSRSTIDEPPRPPPPRGEDFYSTRRQLYDEDGRVKKTTSEPRYITFQKEGSVGIRLTGGNEVGIFVTAVQQGSPASVQGLIAGDKILKVNDMDMNGVTREEAVLFLLSLQDRIDLIVQYSKDEYDSVSSQQRGDSFHIKTHFHCENPSKGEMAFKAGDVFRVVDTLFNGVVGAWQVLKIGRGHQELQRGVIPNKARAEELATAQFNATKKEMNASESRVSFFRRRRTTHRRSKSLSRENWDDVVFSDSISKFPAYERVVLRHPGFVRPVVLFGPIADLARDRLIKDFPDKFTAPLQGDDADKGTSKCGIVRLSNIRDIMDRGKHALLDITPNAVDRLNYAQFYPIVIFTKADTKHIIKQLRHGIPKSQHKSSKKLLEQCQKLDRVWSHVFSTSFVLNDTDTWYRKLRDAIDQQQSGAVWMSETKPVESLSDDFLFPMTTSRLSYASSPESDLELSPGPSASLSLGNLPHLVKSNSDPSIATNQDNLDRDRELGEGMPPPYTNPYDHATAHGRRVTVDNKYGFSPKGGIMPGGGNPEETYGATGRPAPPIGHQGIYGPELPPRIDRASKPPNTLPTSTPGSSVPSRNSSSLLGTGGAGTLGRSAQERLFGGTKSSDELDEYASRNQLLNAVDKRNSGGNSLERQHQQQQDSLDRQRNGGGSGVISHNKQITNNGSYDSVSSYDSFNTQQLTAPNIRLGPNAPDDLKSVPNTNSRTQPTHPNDVVASPRSGHGHQDSLVAANRNSMHEHSRSIDFNSPTRAQYNGGDMNARNMGLKSHESLSPRNSGERPTGISIPQRPSNLGIESPRKHIIETKTDYGKYSRNNSASQADYAKTPKSPQMGPPGPGGAPFKPVPPPKPKNYRPPTTHGGSNGGSNGNNGAMHSSQWDNGEPVSPRSPNGFYYPPTSSHYHQSSQHNMPGSPNANHMSGGHHAQMQQAYSQYSSGNGNGYSSAQPTAAAYMSRGGGGGGDPNNGYNGNMAYSSNYAPRGPAMGNHIPLHPSDRHALDLAGSREQRGSAFELYRKPQIGSGGHHHNMREMEPLPPHLAGNYMTEEQYYANVRRMHFPSPPPPALPVKPPKKSMLKSPLSAIKNAFMKSTRPLRRQKSLAENDDKKPRPILRRQQSMMEGRNAGRMVEMRAPEQYLYAPHPDYYQGYYPPYARLPMRHEPFYPKEGAAGEIAAGPNTYRNLESESIYGSSRGQFYDHEQESLYANRAFIELEKRALEQRPIHGGGRIVRRHSMAAERPMYIQRRGDPSQLTSGGSVRARSGRDYRRGTEEPIYQSRRGSFLFHNDMKGSVNDSDCATIPTDPIYQSRKEMHRDHVQQSKKEMQERIYQSRREVERSASESPAREIITETIYQSRKELKERGFKTRTQLRDQIYQSRREAMESMAEPMYVSRREVQHESILESNSELEITHAQTTIDIDESMSSAVQALRIEELVTGAEEQASTSSSVTFTNGSELHDIVENDHDSEDETLTNKNNNVSDLEKVAAAADKVETPLSRRAMRSPYHISNILKRTAPPPLELPSTSDAAHMFASRTSMETQYTASTASLPVGPPNAQSTPFSSEMSLGKAWGAPARGPITTKGIFDEQGGTLTDSVWSVSLEIPKHAIPAGVNQEIYFTVTDPRLSEAVGGPPLDMENGEQMLSPLVMCGPQGLEFLIPVTLNIPHCAGKTASLGLSLKATDSEKNLQTDWDNIELPSNTAAHTVSVKVDHF